MARPNLGAKVGALTKGKSKEKKKKGNEGIHCSGIRTNPKFLFSCIAFGFIPKGSSIDDNNKKQDGSSPSHHDNGRDEHQASPKSNNNSSAPAAQSSSSTPNIKISPELIRAYNTELHNFSYNDLALATMNFRREHVLGEGGFGRVFKGWLSSNDQMFPTTSPGIGVPVAVKTLNLGGLQGHTEWLAELNYLSQLQHPKLVKLIGFCIEGDKRLLVYEFMPRGSLDFHLFIKRGSVPIPWSTRMRIMLDAAEGLAYLHHEDDDDNKKAVIFRDFKTSNVLLDRELNAKLSDFGLAKDGPVEGRSHVSSRVMGTRGYAAHEYVMTGHLTTKSDVYSFGVVLLEMITGKRVIDKNRPAEEINIVPWAVRQIKDGGRLCHMVLVDPCLHGLYSKKAALKALRLAAKCVSRDPSTRPLMSEVVKEMEVLPTMLDDLMPYHHQPSSSSHHLHAMQVGTSSTSNPATAANTNRYGLRIESSPSGGVPSRFLASPSSSFTLDKAS